MRVVSQSSTGILLSPWSVCDSLPYRAALNLLQARDLCSAVPKADTWYHILRKQIKLEHRRG